MMAGLRMIAKAYGGMTINGVKYVWDYAADEAVKESEMPPGGDRWKASERAKWSARLATGDTNVR